MTSQEYKRPPVTEAVIEIRYAASVDADRLSDVSRHFEHLYPFQHPLANYDVTLGLPPPEVDFASGGNIPQTVSQAKGRRLSSGDQTEILLLWQASLVVAQLAPYPGWDIVFGRFQRDWGIWKKVIGYWKIARIGVRFINRIDIPTDKPINTEDYLNAYARLPSEFGPVTAFGLQAQYPPDMHGCQLALNTASVPSILVGHASVLLDIDIFNEISPPQNDEGIFNLLTEIRAKKNSVFEASVNDRARELFQR